MSKSSVSKGNYFKLRTKKWLEKKGFQVCFLERLQRIFIKGRVIFIKKDQFASDLLAVSSEEIIFVQVKLNKKNIADAVKEFNKFVFPDNAERWIVVWTPRAREPEIITVE